MSDPSKGDERWDVQTASASEMFWLYLRRLGCVVAKAERHCFLSVWDETWKWDPNSAFYGVELQACGTLKSFRMCMLAVTVHYLTKAFSISVSGCNCDKKIWKSSTGLMFVR